jgi:hypothetical protein
MQMAARLDAASTAHQHPAASPSTQQSELSWLYFFQRITHHGQSLLVADVVFAGGVNVTT